MILFSLSAYAGWRQDPEVKTEKKAESRSSQRPEMNNGKNSGYQQGQRYQGNDSYQGKKHPVSPPVTTSGFQIDNFSNPRFGKKSSYEFDNRHHHRRYYPRQGTRVTILPHGYRTVPWHGTRYYYFSGSWYVSSSGSYIVALPPIGLLVPFLPSFYTTIWVSGIPYYYAGGVYYIWEPAEQSYRVTKAPPQQDVVEGDPVPPRLFVYPAQGQSEQQQAADRYECHSWAKSQADFDPTLPTEDIPAAEISQRGTDYNRAMKACLEARGYSVE
jgi:hypothetical protein